ncbi:YcaO-like family protein [Sporolactobacillus sp. STCC-11]|uniref:YcaO-like family protein n=1 Tax=Sporolactobacillus caesalpiniae TaxID=3230362 RepID=UPI00339208D3
MKDRKSERYNLRFYENDLKSFFIREPNKVHLIKSDDANTAVKIGNVIANNDNVDQFDPDNVSEMRDFIELHFNNLKQIVNNDEIIIYINSNFESFSKDISLPIKVKYTNNFNEFMNSKIKKKIVLLSNLSVNQIKKYAKQLYSMDNYYAIVSLDGYLLFTYINNSHYCLNCVIERWIETHPYIYKFNKISNIPYSSNVALEKLYFQFLINEIINNEELIGKIILISLKQLSIKRYSIIKKESCYCNPHTIKTNNINIIDRDIKYDISGSRIKKPKDAFQQVQNYISPFGPVYDLNDQSNYDKKLYLPVFGCLMASNPLEKSFIVHGGKGPDADQAKMSAIGEALERYNARVHGTEPMIEASYNELLLENKPVLNPIKLILDPEYSFPYSSDKKIDWVKGVKLLDEKDVYIPANAVFFIYQPKVREKQFIPQDTTGLASGSSTEEAIYQGLCEIIERDSYAIYYRQGLIGKDVDQKTIKNYKIKELIDYLKSNSIKVHLKYLKNDTHICVIHCVTEDRNNNFPIFTHGAGASLNPSTAILRSITEAIQLRVSQVMLNKNPSSETIKNYKPYFAWGHGDTTWINKFLENSKINDVSFESLPNHSSDNLKSNIQFIINKLHALNYSVYAVNLSRTDNPIKTVRVIVPGFQSTDDTLRRISPRMFELPKQLKMSDFKTSIDDLETKPFFS